MDKYQGGPYHEVDRARRLLRQGQKQAALDILERALARWEEPPRPSEDDDQDLELAFHPRKDDVPQFYFEEGVLCIEDEGWDIDPELVETLARSAQEEYGRLVPPMELRRHIRDVLKSSIKNGKIRRKEGDG